MATPQYFNSITYKSQSLIITLNINKLRNLKDCIQYINRILQYKVKYQVSCDKFVFVERKERLAERLEPKPY